MTNYVTGINVLVEVLNTEQRTDGGIVLPSQDKTESALIRGIVRIKGPGFLVPFPKQEDELHALLENHTKPIYIPLDVEIGDTVYFPKSAMETVTLDGRVYSVVSYMAIKVFSRDEGR